MLSFSTFKKPEDTLQSSVSSSNALPATQGSPAVHALDHLTGGAFSAPTSGERSAKIREWLATNPTLADMQEVFKDMTARDKGAAKPLREKLDEIKRTASQEQIASSWAEKAQALLAASKLNIADALAWQRDAAKAGAALSKEPLAALRTELNERVKHIEDLQHRAQVQREAAMLLAQRIELLSTKPLADAQAVFEALHADVQHWKSQTSNLPSDSLWSSVDAKFAPQLETAQSQLDGLWSAFSAALAQAIAALGDHAAPLPAVPVWAEAIRAQRAAARGEAVEKKDKPAKPKIDPEKREAANLALKEATEKLEKELAEGHGKASVQAANDLRAALKEHAEFADDKTEAKARDAVGAAGELEGWQRWRANQLREELIGKAQALVAQPLGGRKQQEAVRGLRDAWKQTDQGGMPNHGMWRKFDEACNEAHKIVEAWVEKVKEQEAQHKAQRSAIIEEIQSWTATNAARTDWKAVDRELHQLSEKWRAAGHIGEKAFAELQPQYKAAIKAAHAPLEAAQSASKARRKLLIEEAKALGGQSLRIDHVKALQERWRAESVTVPLGRVEENKLWDAFRTPIDEAFATKDKERERQAAAVSEHDKAVLDATKALDAAIASQDAKAIRSAMDALDATARGTTVSAAAPATVVEKKQPVASVDIAQSAIENVANPAAETSPQAPEPAPVAAVTVTPKPVVARRGDDRPVAKLSAAPATARAPEKFGARRDGRDSRQGRDTGRGQVESQAGSRTGSDRRSGASEGRDSGADRGPRLSNTAFYALRDGMDKAHAALKKLAAQAHGESVVTLLTAWENRNAETLPSAQQLSRAVTPQVRSTWVQALGRPAAGSGAQALLRLEMAAEVPTPAEHLNDRRALQLSLLTQRGAASPRETWAQDTAAVLSSGYDASQARRLQQALKALLR